MIIIAPGLGRGPEPALRALTKRLEGGSQEPDAWAEVCVKETGLRNGAHGPEKFGFKDLAAVHWNLPPEQLHEFALAGKERQVVEGGAFCGETGAHTGGSPKDKFVLCYEQTE